jgi:tetratricopeptide (TPR) repeat protein
VLLSACRRVADWQGAIKRYTASIEMFPTAEGYGNRAAALMQQGRWQEAAGDCTQALGHNPRFVKAYIRRSRCHAELGDHARALQVPAPPYTLQLLCCC